MPSSPKPRPDVLLLSAGRGQRLRPLTDRTPKALLQVGDKTLLQHHLARLADGGFTGAVINLAWLGGEIREFLTDEASRYGLDIRYSSEAGGALETGGGIVHALTILRGDPFIVINADVLCDVDFAALQMPAECDVQLVLTPRPGYRRRGDFALHNGRLQLATAAEWVYTGIGMFRRRAFDGLSKRRFPLRPVLERAIAAGRAGGVVHEGLWMDVGAPGRLAKARELYE